MRLLLQSARLLLRDGAAPFRSLGHLSVRPRPYQFVPLVMALRQPAVRLLIADDVGVDENHRGGADCRAELLDRGTAHRVAVLCPPTCASSGAEPRRKFHIGRVDKSGLARARSPGAPDTPRITPHLPPFRRFVASIDAVRELDHYRAAFLQHCPDLVLVDERTARPSPPQDEPVPSSSAMLCCSTWRRSPSAA